MPFAETAPGVMTEEEASVGAGEQRRAMYEFLRHISTLDSAALVLIATLIEKVFAQPSQRGAIGSAMVCFLLSLTASGFTYLMLIAHYPRVGARRMTSTDRRWYMWSMMGTFVGFVAGMTQVAWFFAANWFHW